MARVEDIKEPKHLRSREDEISRHERHAAAQKRNRLSNSKDHF